MSQIMLNVIPAEINIFSVNDVTNGVVPSLLRGNSAGFGKNIQASSVIKCKRATIFNFCLHTVFVLSMKYFSDFFWRKVHWYFNCFTQTIQCYTILLTLTPDNFACHWKTSSRESIQQKIVESSPNWLSHYIEVVLVEMVINLSSRELSPWRVEYLIATNLRNRVTAKICEKKAVWPLAE